MLIIVISLFIGICLGFVLEKSGVVEPENVIKQFTLGKFILLKMILTVIISSMLIFGLLEFFGALDLEAFSFSIERCTLGGVLLGYGIVLSGAIPIAMFAQIGRGYKDAIFIVLGGISGGMIYHLILPFLQYIEFSSTPKINSLYEWLELSYFVTVILVSACLICILTGIHFFTKVKKIRKLVHKFQINCAYYPPKKYNGSCLDGRDITYKIIPDADFKFFITANIKTRAKRRYLELKRLNKKISFNMVLKSIKKRDKSDYNRKNSPLTKKYSMLINSENLTKRACFLQIKKIIDKKLNINGNL